MFSVDRGLARGLCALLFSISGLSASFAAQAQNALTTNLAFDPNVIAPGDAAVMTIYVVNNNSAPATALAIDSALPAGLQIVGYGGGAGPSGEPNCGGTPSGSGGPSGGSYGLGGGSVPGINAGQAGVCVVKYLVTSYASAGQTYPTTLAPTAVSASVGGNQVNAATSASNSLTVQNMAPLNGNKNFSPSTSATGGPVTLTINIANPNNFAMDGVAYTDALPNGMTLLSTPAPTATGCGGATLSAAAGASSVGIAGATIAAGATCTVVVGVQAPASTGNAVNTIPVGAVTSSQRGAAAANTSPINATLSVQNQLSVTKSFAAGNVFVDGSPTTMTIQMSNPTQYPVSNLAFNDAFPGGPGFVLDASAGGSAPVVSDSCNFNHANVTDGAGALDVAGGSIAANGSCQIVVWVRGSAAGAYVNQLGVNTVTGTGGANGSTPTSNGNAASATLSVSTISNGGGPGNYKPNLYKRLSTAPWMPGNPPFNTYLRVTRPTAPATQQVAYVFVAVENTLTTSALNLATLSDVLDAAGFTNIAGRSLRIDPATVAQNVTYGAYANTTTQTCSLGTVTATGSTATTLNLQFANTSVPAAAAQSDGSINPGTCVISFPVYIDATAPITDSLGTYHDALGADSVTGVLAANNVGFSAGPSDGVTLVVNDGVTIRKSFYPTTVAPNGVADLKITLTNVNAMPLTGVSYQDPLPAGLVLAGNGSPAFSADCGAASLSSAVVNGQTVLTIANASVPAATGSPVNPGTCVLDVYVQQAAGQPQSANYPNQIAAGSMSSDQGISNTQSSNTATLSVGDLSIAVSKSFAQATVTAGETTSMSIVVANPQTAKGATLNNVSFQDAFPAGLIAAANPNVQVVCSAGSTGTPTNASLSSATPPVLSVAGIVLAPSGACTISVDVQLTTANAPVTNVIAGGTVTTSEGATNVGDASATIVGVPASAVVKSIAPATATIGQPVTATVRVLNTTAGAIGNIDVLDRINPSGGYPSGVVPQGYLAPPNASWQIVPGSVALAANSAAGCALGSNTTTAGTANDQTQLNAISVPANAYCDVTYQLVASATGQYRNAILQADVGGGPVACANNQNPCFTYGDLTVVAPGSIALTKQTSGGTPAAGAQWSFTLTPTDGCSVAGVTPNPLVLAAGATGSFANVPPVQGDGSTACHYDIVESGGDPNFVLSNPGALQNLSVASATSLALTASNAYVPKPEVGIAKTTTATGVAPNGTIVYTVTASNTGVVDASGATLADPLPAGVASAAWTCAANGGAQCPSASGSGAINATIAAFPVGSSLVYTVTATVAANPPASIVNVATVTPPGGGACADGSAPPCSATVITPVTPLIDIRKSTTQTVVPAGGTLTYSVVVSNAGTVDAGGTRIRDPLPAGITAASWTCAASGSVQCPHASGSGALDETVAAPFTPAASLTYTITATVSAAPPASIVNIATTTPPNGGGCANGQAPPCTSTAITPPGPVVGVSKTTSATRVAANGTIVYTVAATNLGAVDGAGTTLADPLPAGIASATWTCAANGGAQCPAASGSGAINATLAVFPAGSGLVYTVTATVVANPPANIVNVASVTPPGGGTCASGQTPPCTSTVTTPVAPTVAIGKTTTATSATAGGTITYTVTASNVGSADAAGATLADPLPAGIASATWTCAANAGAQCPAASGSGAINATLAVFPAGSSLVYTVTATVAANPPANIVNVASVTPPGGGACADGQTPPCTSTVTTPAAKAQVDIAKSASSAVLEPSGNVSYVVTVRNSGTVDASGSSVSDPLPLGIASASWTCSASGGAQCPSRSGSGAINATIATFPTGSSLVYTISAQIEAAPPQSITNIASVAPPAAGTCANGQTLPCTAAVTGTVDDPGPPADIAKVPATTTWTLILMTLTMLLSVRRRAEKARRRR